MSYLPLLIDPFADTTFSQLCTDKTGTLTQNEMSVVAGSIGVHLKFADRLAENAARSNANDDIEATPASPRVGRTDFSTDMTDVSRHLSPSLATLFNESICINSTAFEGVDDQGKETGFVGSKTETALLAFAKAQGWADYKSTRTAAKVVHMIPFSSERKAMGVVIELPGGGYRLLIKGASEVLAKISNRHVVVVSEGLKEVESGTVRTEDFTDETRSNISQFPLALLSLVLSLTMRP
jgi:Ca2+-transporting ATPase